MTVICMLFSVSANAAAYFTDVNASSWYYECVKYVSDGGAMIGVENGVFNPDGQLTRAMAVTVLSRICGEDLSSYAASPFTDVDMNRYYGAHIAWAKDNGIIRGMTEKTFEPNDYMTREQVCVMLSNFFESRGFYLPNVAVGQFSDYDEISGWARDSVDRMHRGGVVNGKGNNLFDPKGNITRAEYAQIILNTNLINLLAK